MKYVDFDLLDSVNHVCKFKKHRNDTMPTQVKKIILKKLQRKVGTDTLNSMCEYAEEYPPTLVGSEKPPSFVKDIVYATLYKDLFCAGFRTVEEECKFGYHLPHSNLEVNIPRMRTVLREWAMQHISLGNLQEWEAAASKCGLKGATKSANLWIDSSDFPFAGKRSTSKRSDRWSFKLNSPGRRYNVVVKGNGTVIKIWGPYSPKLYDGDHLSSIQDEFGTIFDGATFLGDNHYMKGKQLFKNITFYCNVAERRSNPTFYEAQEDSEEEAKEVLSKNDKSFNANVRRNRARMEKTFADLTNLCDSFNKPWAEDDIQHGHMFRIMVAICNLKKH